MYCPDAPSGNQSATLQQERTSNYSRFFWRESVTRAPRVSGTHQEEGIHASLENNSNSPRDNGDACRTQRVVRGAVRISAVELPQFAIELPQSAIELPQSAVELPAVRQWL